MALLRISLFGELQITCDDRNLTTISTPRLQLLLAYLLLHRQAPQQRQELGQLFWPDSGQTQARTNLRNLVHLLRRALPEAERFIQGDTTTIQWREDAPYSLDIAIFEHCLEEAVSARRQGRTPTMQRACEQAIALYRGELLAGWDERWILPARGHLRQRLIATLDDLLDTLEYKRAYAEAIPYLHHLIRIDPLQENAYQRLMQLYSLNGDRASALRVYHIASTTLEREIGVEPGRPLRETYARLSRGHEPEASAATPRPNVGVRGPLVGRAHEWAQLQKAWREVRTRGFKVIILWGEAGIGKTRLAEELIAWVQRLGYAAAATRCFAAEGDLPYEPIATWLRCDALRSRWSQLPTIWLHEASLIVPELVAATPPRAGHAPLRELWRRKRLFEGLAHLITMTQEPQLLVIDDLQSCDQDSLEWLHYLLRFKPGAPILLVGTARSEELTARHPLQPLLTAMRQEDLVIELELAPLDQAETAALTASIIGGPLEAADLAQLYQSSEGNPLFIVELARVIGQDRERAAAEVITALPPRVRAVLTTRLAQLSATGRELAGLAAAIGRDFTFPILRQASDVDEEALVRGLDELWQRRIIREQGGGNAYAFSHEKLREVAYAELSLSRRRYWHHRIAEAIEAVHESQVDAVAGQVALHFDLAGMWKRAIGAYERAAATARAVYANGEAMAALRRALALMGAHLPAAADQQEYQAIAARLHTQLGEIFALSGLFEDARDAFGRALSATPPDAALQQARLRLTVGDTWRGQQRYAEAGACYDLAQSALDQDERARDAGWWQTWIALQIGRIWAHFFQGHITELGALIARLEAPVAQHGTPTQRALLLGCIAALRINQERHIPSGETVSCLRQALELHELGASLLQDTATARFGLGYALLWAGDLQAAEALFQHALQEAQLLGDGLLRVRCAAFLCVVARQRGQQEAALQQSHDLLALAEQRRFHHYQAIAQANLAWAMWRSGRLSDAETHGRAAIELWGIVQAGPYQWLALWPLIGALAQRGRLAEAVPLISGLLHPAQQPMPSAVAIALRDTLEAWAQTQVKRALARLDSALATARELGYH